MNGRAWHSFVKLSKGENDIAIEATKHGFTDFTSSITITRNLSPAELAAIEAAKKAHDLQVAQARAAHEAQVVANFKSSAATVPYAELLKDSGPFRGKRVVFRGQILQIQQSGGSGGIMLLSVTDEGSGFWTDNVWVDYNHATPANENDVITVYGTVTGTKSYDTQSGGSTYVPQMRARYIVQTG